ncbi:carboxymuconolactone decarboxylase family protein [Sphingobium nicotianae]|uniref:Carboxymuconolactone decarboxylase family protein n=1 Tax=Sphingobium nicotianae TaxID=2782607 RepID=A0A9X1IRW3_9SPHN|nr:carboxymuconolactone decarboxylase family protein [Sphingobium nicotianae]MBT2187828.1 carboxymuconolactone decarboxylase family protein [Sphingobium nicotianae]
MPRIPYPDVSKLEPQVQKMLAGTPLNIVRMAALASPAAFKAAGELGYALSTPENLDPHLRETAILRVGYLTNSKYELHQHLSIAKAVGLTDAQIEAIGSMHYDRLDPTMAAVARFTDDVVRNVAPSDENLAALRALVSDRVVINLVMCIGHYGTVARIIGVTGIEPDEEALKHLPTNEDEQAQ